MTLSLEKETASKEHIYLHPKREKGKFEQKMKIYGLEIVLALALSFLFIYAYRVVQDRRRAVPQIYEVFLSFRGPDTRTGFTDFLCKTLENAGVQVFLDDKAIPPGKKIGRELLRAIRTCTIAIPIISEQYARSEWCLQELTEIMDRHREHGISVFPVFYKVDVVDVGRQRGSFEEALREHERKYISEVSEWRKALTSVAKIRGWISQAIADGREAELVEMVRERVLSELKRMRIQRLPMIIRSVYLYFSEKSECQVFLAFRDPDVQTGLATYIRADLVAKRIRVFRHDDSSLIGTDVADSIRNAICQCEIYIPIFSKNFASSRWFLEGLAHMVGCKRERQNILPIFYKVSPSQVRSVLRNCQNDTLIYENPEGRITYLEDVVERKGWILKEEIGDEAALVRDVVEKVLALLNNPQTDDEPIHID